MNHQIDVSGYVQRVLSPARLHSFFVYTLLLSHAATAHAQTATGPSPPPRPYLQTPTPRQLTWHSLEYYAFVHFGPNTFTNEEWGKSQSSPDVFSPTNLSTDQWAETFASAGMKGMILTAKHHDGMALWNSSTTTYKIANGSWAKKRLADGLDSDVVRMAAISARKYGLKFGVYLSPWDIHRDPAIPKPGLKGTAYDEPQIFGDKNAGDYNELYARQLTELVTMQISPASPQGGSEEKIELFEIWLDGASGSDTVQTFNWTSFRDIIRVHQPAAIMWGHQGVDARWVGNEDGVTAPTNWHTINRTQDQSHYGGEQLQTGQRNGLYWTPAEADARIRSGWFWHAGERSLTGKQLMDMWLASVGRSVNLLLDVPPDRTGRLDEADVKGLMEFKRLREQFLNRDIIAGLSRAQLNMTASNVRGGDLSSYRAANILDGKSDTYWTMDDGKTTGWVEMDFGGDIYSVDAFIVQEHIALGQRIGGYVIEAIVDGSYRTVVTGTSMGYKRVHTMTSGSIKATKARLRVTQASAVPVIQSFQVLGTR